MISLIPSLSTMLLAVAAETAHADATGTPALDESAASMAATWSLATVVGGSVLLAVGYWLYTVWVKRREWQASQDPWHLFQQLCKAHHLNKAQIRLLRKLIRQEADTSPISLFIEPERVRRLAKLPTFKGQQQRIQELAKTLFGALATA